MMPDLGTAAFGYWGLSLINVVLSLDVFGCCWAYCLFVSESLESVTHVRQEIWTGIVLGLFFILSFIRPIKIIGFFSIVADCCVFFGVIILLVGVFVSSPRVKAFDLKNFPIFFGNVLFAFQSAELAIPIHNSMQKQRKFPLVIGSVFSVVCALYMSFGLLVYFRLADNTVEMITQTITIAPLRIAGSIMFIISVFVNLLVWLFPL